ncbi:MAG: hypothetical protein ACKOEC_06345 [Acidimicrobiia bacterium]
MNEALPLIRPTPARGARTVARCHAALAAHRRRLERDARTPMPKAAIAERFVLVGACVAYLLAMAGDILRTLNLR